MQIRRSLEASLSWNPPGSFLASPSARTKGDATVRVLHINLVYLRCSGSSWDLVPRQYGKGLQEDFSLEDCWTLVTPVVEESHFELCLDASRFYNSGYIHENILPSFNMFIECVDVMLFHRILKRLRSFFTAFYNGYNKRIIVLKHTKICMI